MEYISKCPYYKKPTLPLKYSWLRAWSVYVVVKNKWESYLSFLITWLWEPGFTEGSIGITLACFPDSLSK